ncbi:MAG TPA: hypothetical protein VNG33_18600 [Polyangiaceae bacterium]|nr:hypothetical protein [Polyangiaceae bacterium]
MKKALLACLVAATAGGCHESKVATDDVIQLTLCPPTDANGDSTSCSTSPDADSQSAVVVQVCTGDAVSNSDRRTDLTATLRATRGTWAGHDASDPTSLTLPFGSSRCQFATLTVDGTPGANRIDVTLLGYTASQTIVQQPTPLKFVDFTAASLPPLQGTDPSTVQLTVAAHSESGGLPSVGTRIEFATMNLKPAGSVTMSPLATTLDSDGHATVSVFVPSTIDSFTIVGTIAPRTPSEPAASGSLDIQRQ